MSSRRTLVACACLFACATEDAGAAAESSTFAPEDTTASHAASEDTGAADTSSGAADLDTTDEGDSSSTGAPACDELDAASWHEHPSSHFADLGFPDLLGANPGGVINAWSTAVLDTSQRRLVVFGGGHGDAANNGVYAFDLEGGTWSTMLPYLEPPPGWPPTECLEAWPLDPLTPVSRHTYGNLVFVPANDERANDLVVLHGGSRACGSGGFGTHTWLLDLTTLVWEDLGELADGPGPVQMRCEYGPAHDLVFCAHGDLGNWFRFRTFDPTLRTWTVLIADGPALSVDAFGSTLVDSPGSPLDRKLVLVGGTADVIRTVDLDAAILAEQPTTGAPVLTASGRPGVAWDEHRHRLVAYNGRAAEVDPSSVWELDPETMEWEELALAGGPGRNEGSTGMYGRWRWQPDSRAFVVVNAADQNVFEYRPAGACR
jgi:hypothetical protein